MITRDQYGNAKFMLTMLMDMQSEGLTTAIGEPRELRVFEHDNTTVLLFGAVDANVSHEPDDDCPYDEHVMYGFVLEDGTISPPLTSGTTEEHDVLGFNLWEAARAITPDEVYALR